MIKQAHSLIQIPNETQFIGFKSIGRVRFCLSILQSSAFQIRPLGNLTSTRSRNHHRRPPMAASAAADNPSSTSSSSSNPFIFSPDPPPRLPLTPHQIKLCSEALEAFREKLQMPDVINQEFARLQVLVFFLMLYLFLLSLCLVLRKLEKYGEIDLGCGYLCLL